MIIDILLATYNGAAWLCEQLDSLLAQSVTDWRLIARDDHSSDATPAMLQTYQTRYPDRIRILASPERLGAKDNFGALLSASTGDYAMCCDQDDVWMADKIEKTLRRMHYLEAMHGTDTPLLVHSDAILTDGNLVPTASFAAHHHLAPTYSPFARLLVQNTVHGCSSMANRALVKRAIPIPPGARMHDMWLALVAAAFGHIDYLPEPTLYYRQHGGNVIGTKRKSRRLDIQTMMQANRLQAQSFHDRYAGDLSPGDRATIEALIRSGHENSVQRRLTLLRHGLLRRPLLQNAGILLFA